MDSTSTTSPLLSARADAVLPVLAAVLAALILSAFVDVGVTALATGAVGVQFRFQVVGVFFACVPPAVTLLVVMAGLAILGGQRNILRGASIAALAIAVIVLVLVPVFGLDLLQFRHTVSQANLRGFTLAALKTVGSAILVAALAGWAGWRGIQASGKSGGGGSRKKGGQGLVVGQE
jgi:chromate transport protein ChrA